MRLLLILLLDYGLSAEMHPGGLVNRPEAFVPLAATLFFVFGAASIASAVRLP